MSDVNIRRQTCCHNPHDLLRRWYGENHAVSMAAQKLSCPHCGAPINPSDISLDDHEMMTTVFVGCHMCHRNVLCIEVAHPKGE